jgi:hypothetical protein
MRVKIREVLATVKRCNWRWQEQKLVRIPFTDGDEKYQLLKPYCVEYGKKVIFSKTDSEILLPDLARRKYRAKEYSLNVAVKGRYTFH